MNTFLHHPPHYFLDNSWYFITAHTLGIDFPLKQLKSKQIWVSKLHEIADEFAIKIHAYVLLENHYHLIGFFSNSNNLPDFIHRLHGATSYYINKVENQTGRKIWHNYWDRIIRNEVDFYTKLNYIHYNPVKHGYVSDLEKWEFSTYKDYYQDKGNGWLQDCWNTYPIKDSNFEN